MRARRLVSLASILAGHPAEGGFTDPNPQPSTLSQVESLAPLDVLFKGAILPKHPGSEACTYFSEVDVLDVRHKLVNFEAGYSPGPPDWWARIQGYLAHTK